MPIEFACPSCQKQFRVADSMAGKQARCTCGQVVTVPGGAAAPPPTSPRSASFDRLLQEAQEAAAAKRAAEEAARAERAAAEAAKVNPYAAPGATPSYAPQRFVSSKAPHRGGTILTLGILGLICCAFCSFFAWGMGMSDLKQMKAGHMDDSGYGLTMAGMILGVVGVILTIAGVILNVVFYTMLE